MQLTNKEIYDMIQPLGRLMGEPLPIKASYRLLKTVKTLDPQATIIEELRVGLIKKYGKEKDGEFRIEKDAPEMADYVREFKELLSESGEYEIEQTLLPDNVNISVADLQLLEKVIII